MKRLRGQVFRERRRAGMDRGATRMIEGLACGGWSLPPVPCKVLGAGNLGLDFGGLEGVESALIVGQAVVASVAARGFGIPRRLDWRMGR